MLTIIITLQRRKSNNKPRDASTPHGSTAAESVRNLIKKNPKYSKRINYEALKDLFVENGGSPSVAAAMTTGDDDKDDAELLVMPLDEGDKSEGEGIGIGSGMPTVIVEESGELGLASESHIGSGKRKTAGPRIPTDDDPDDDMYEGSEEEKEDDIGGWEDAYEQEV